MEKNRKKLQIIKCYIDEILPYLHYSNFADDLKISGELKYGNTVFLDDSNLKKYINYRCIDNSHLYLDFSHSSIKDIYKGLVIISKISKSA